MLWCPETCCKKSSFGYCRYWMHYEWTWVEVHTAVHISNPGGILRWFWGFLCIVWREVCVHTVCRWRTRLSRAVSEGICVHRQNEIGFQTEVSPVLHRLTPANYLLSSLIHSSDAGTSAASSKGTQCHLLCFSLSPLNWYACFPVFWASSTQL